MSLDAHAFWRDVVAFNEGSKLGPNLSSIGVIANSHICISSALQHSGIGCVKSGCCETVSNGVNVLVHGVICCCSVAEQYCIEHFVLHLHVKSLAVLIGCLLVPLLLKGSIASL